MVSYLYHPPPLSYLTSPLLYAHPHIQVDTIPILTQTVIGSITIFPTISTLENYLTPLKQQKTEHETELSPPSSSPPSHPAQALGSTLWTQTPSSATNGCFLRYKATHLEDAFFAHSNKEGDSHTLEKKKEKRISTDFEEDILQIPKQKEKGFGQNPRQIFRTLSKSTTQKLLSAGKSKRNQVSILGPRPTLPLFHYSPVFLQPPPLFYHSHTNLSPVSPNPFSPLSQRTALPVMTSFTEDEEAFIQKFIGLSTEDGACEVVAVPKTATSSTNWALCLLARIVTDRTVLDGPFAKSMVYAWGVDPATLMRQVEKNCYLIEFNDVSDLNSTLLGGPWTYRGDLVALRQVTSDLDLKASLVESATIWVLFLNLPVNAFKDEGIQMIGQAIGTPVSVPVKGFIHGKRFVKLKIRIKLGEAVKDTLIVPHPSLGQLKVYCSYEKVSRICFFCGKLGHEMAGCHDHARLTMLVQKPGQESRFKDLNILSPRLGEWLTDPAMVPTGGLRKQHQQTQNVPSEAATRAGNKRPLENSEQEVSSSAMLLDYVQIEQQEGFEEGLNPLHRKKGLLTFNKKPKSAGLNAPAPPP